MVRHYPAGTLAVVCDGMGGHQFGALASKTAVNAFVEAFESETDGCVTVRDRDTMAQERVAIADLNSIIADKVSITSLLKTLQ